MKFKNTNKVITLQGWKRPDLLEKTLGALEKCWGVEDYLIYISIDGGPQATQAIRNQMYARIKASPLVSQIKCEFLKNNLGCAGHTYYNLKKGFEYGGDFVVHLEDDTVPNKDFLRFMEWARDNKDNFRKGTMAVSCLTLGKDVPSEDDLPKTYYKERFGCHGWGMWRDFWEYADTRWFGIHWNKRRNFNIDPPTGDEFLNVIIKSPRGSWAWMISCYLAYKWAQDVCGVDVPSTVFPKVSRIANIGKEGTWQNPAGWEKTFGGMKNFSDSILPEEEIAIPYSVPPE